MPSGYLNESHVQHVAVEWLANYYASQLKPKAIVPALETLVRRDSKYGTGRADGLITILLGDDTIYTISVEAKSARTWHNIRIQYSDLKWIVHILLVGTLSLISGFYIGTMLGSGWFLELCVPVLFFIVGCIVFSALSYGSSRYQTIAVVNQIRDYPANERWIALSTDVFNRIERAKQYSDFENVCQRKGIGLLRVTSREMVTPVIIPKKQNTPKQLSCYLDCYAREARIRKELQRVQSTGTAITEPINLNEELQTSQENPEVE